MTRAWFLMYQFAFAIMRSDRAWYKIGDLSARQSNIHSLSFPKICFLNSFSSCT